MVERENIKMKSNMFLYRSFLLLIILTTGYQGLAHKAGGDGKILLIPLDDRPPCLQFPVEMGNIANKDIITPPREMLGRFERPGDPEAIRNWLLNQSLQDVEAIIISVDMLVYGGLVASRNYHIDREEAHSNLNVLKEFREKAGEIPIYLNSVITRLAPTATSENEDYRKELAQWAEISAIENEKQQQAAKTLENKIPANVLRDYTTARERNSLINSLCLDYVNEGIADFLILSQDDAKPQGIHVKEKEALRVRATDLGLDDKIKIQAGADEISMVLMTRHLLGTQNVAPKVHVIYSSDEMKYQVMPFEDGILHKSVASYIETAGAVLEEDRANADLLFYVYTSRNENNNTKPFMRSLVNSIEGGNKVILADIDPKGNVQGGSVAISEFLIENSLLEKLYGYASWNTAGNTLGTALPQGLIYNYSRSGNSLEKDLDQNWFLLHRFINDFIYNNLIRKGILDENADIHWSTRLEDEEVKMLEQKTFKFLEDYLLEYDIRQKIINVNIDFPWNRLFEIEVDFNLDTSI